MLMADGAVVARYVGFVVVAMATVAVVVGAMVVAVLVL